eukprot:6213138-Pleurochrysis_carterae.AAC.6
MNIELSTYMCASKHQFGFLQFWTLASAVITSLTLVVTAAGMDKSRSSIVLTTGNAVSVAVTTW